MAIGATSRSHRGPNAFGIFAVLFGFVSILEFIRATHRGKGEEIIPLAMALLAGGIAAVLAATGWIRGARRGRERVSVLCGFALGLVGVGLVVLGGPTVIRNGTNRQPCPSHLRMIGQALWMYSKGNHGRLPDRLADLAIDPGSDLTPDALVCPDGPDAPAAGNTPAALAAEFAKPGHVSYDYLGTGRLWSDFSAGNVVVFEPPHNHNSDGGYALFGDGHVEYVYPAGKLRDAVARVRRQLSTPPAVPGPQAE